MNVRSYRAVLLAYLLGQATLFAASQELTLTVPLAGNSWLVRPAPGGTEQVDSSGWSNWGHSRAVFRIYFRVDRPGEIRLAAPFGLKEGRSTIRCRIGGLSRSFVIRGGEPVSGLGTWPVSGPGYIRIDLQGITRTGSWFGHPASLVVTGSAVDERAAYVKNKEGNYFYWGRRGPSVHLNYDLTGVDGDIEWFYNEITVPVGYDPVGSYFMADGFREGYFGMQVNGPAERRILFSVWSPFSTDNPNEIPEDQKIILLRKGRDVHAGEFGQEGSGGQSYLRFPWKAGRTYGFLLRGKPLPGYRTEYTAWFFAPERGNWMLIASFIRPSTSSYLTRLHSFLENFEPESGYIERKAWFGNQWVRTAGGQWKPLGRALFTGDATAQIGYRLDYGGAAQGGRFLLRNGGFFNNPTPLKSRLDHDLPVKEPRIDFSSLE
ncbi:MAG TPA: DUF3472 domain-containing protein [Chitinophagaceae bacterium]|nr:DUF3472 domain-containing protein [Chitinophagaceae bacterium]